MTDSPAIHILELEELQADMDTIDQILKLSDEGFSIYGALDFSELYTYAFPLTAGIERWSRDFRKNLAREACLQIALSYIIAGDRTILEKELLMLPSHLIELRDRMSLLSRGIHKIYQGSMSFERHAVSRIISELGGENEIREELALHKATGQVRESLMVKLIGLGENYESLVPLLGFLSGDTAKGFSAIRELIEQKRIRDVVEMWPSTKRTLRIARKSSSTWTNQIQQLRDDPDRYYASRMDGEALSLLFVLNRILSRENKLVVLLTHSRTVLEVAGKVTIGDVLHDVDSDLPVVISPQWATVYLAHHGLNAERTRHMLRKSKQRISEIRRLEGIIDNIHAREAGREAAGRIGMYEKKIAVLQEQLAKRIRRAEQLALASQSKKFIRGVARPHLHRQDRFVKMLSSLNNLLADADVSQRLAMEASEHFESVPSFWAAMMSTLSVQAMGFSLKGAKKIVIGFFKKGTYARIAKTVLEGEIQNLTYTLQFRNERTRRCARRIASKLRDGDHIGALRALLGLIEPVRLSTEDHLLIAYFLVTVREYSLAQDEIRRGLQLKDGLVHELQFLRALIARQHREFGRGIYACRRAINCKRKWQEEHLPEEDRREDPRYHNELGFELCLKADEGIRESKALVAALRKGLACYDTARKWVAADEKLKLRIMNNRAYTLMRIFELTNLSEDFSAMASALSELDRALAGQEDAEPSRPKADTLLWGRFLRERFTQRLGARVASKLVRQYDQLIAEAPQNDLNRPTYERHRAEIARAARSSK